MTATVIGIVSFVMLTVSIAILIVTGLALVGWLTGPLAHGVHSTWEQGTARRARRALERAAAGRAS